MPFVLKEEQSLTDFFSSHHISLMLFNFCLNIYYTVVVLSGQPDSYVFVYIC